MTLGSLSRERWNMLEPLLDEALELDTEHRSTFLDEACRGNAVLRAEIDALLAACEKGDEILSAPAAVAYAPLLAEGTLQHTVGLRLPLSDIARAHDLVEQGQVLGNVVLDLP